MFYTGLSNDRFYMAFDGFAESCTRFMQWYLILPSSTLDAYEAVSMEAEKDLNTEVGDKPLPMLFVEIKTEKKVSFVSVCALFSIFHKCPE